MFRRTTLSTICALLFAAAAATTLSAADRAGSFSFRVMTYNLRFDFESDGAQGNRWADRASRVAELVKLSQTTVLCEQEDKAEQVDDLKKLLPEFEFFGRGRNPNGTGERAAIAWKKAIWEKVDGGDVWLSDTPEVAGSNTWGTKYPHKVTWVLLQPLKGGAKKQVLFTSTHFDEHPDATGVTARNRSAHVLRELVNKKTASGKLPAVVCGDFNSGAEEEAHAAMIAPGAPMLSDVFETLRPPEPSTGTCHEFTGKAGRKRIDWILTTPVVKAREIHIDRHSSKDGHYGSDHFAVTAELEVHDAGGTPAKAKVEPKVD